MRSYVLRAGRLTPAQARALDTLWPRYGLALPVAPARLDLDAAFGRRAPRVLEIGFGDGEALRALALEHPRRDFLGVEVYPPGVGHLLGTLAAQDIRNVRVLRADAREVLDALEPASLTAIYVLFPDPWPKKRHHKRRLVDTAFVAAAQRCLQAGGLLHLATDWPDYAGQMHAALAAAPTLIPLSSVPPRPQTKYERRGRRLGHPVTELAARRV